MTCLALAGKCGASGARGFFAACRVAVSAVGPSSPASLSKPTRPTMPRPVPDWAKGLAAGHACRVISVHGDVTIECLAAQSIPEAEVQSDDHGLFLEYQSTNINSFVMSKTWASCCMGSSWERSVGMLSFELRVVHQELRGPLPARGDRAGGRGPGDRAHRSGPPETYRRRARDGRRGLWPARSPAANSC